MNITLLLFWIEITLQIPLCEKQHPNIMLRSKKLNLNHPMNFNPTITSRIENLTYNYHVEFFNSPTLGAPIVWT